jgi:hypothetical protein
MQQDGELWEEWVLHEEQQRKLLNEKNEEKVQEFEEALNQLFCTVTGRGILLCCSVLKSYTRSTRTEE